MQRDAPAANQTELTTVVLDLVEGKRKNDNGTQYKVANALVPELNGSSFDKIMMRLATKEAMWGDKGR